MTFAGEERRAKALEKPTFFANVTKCASLDQHRRMGRPKKNDIASHFVLENLIIRSTDVWRKNSVFVMFRLLFSRMKITSPTERNSPS